MMKTTLAWLLGLLLLAASPAHSQSVPKKYLSTASNNSTLVFGRPSTVNLISAVNTTAVIYYLKMYSKATAPTCGTDIPVLVFAVPASASGGYPLSLVPNNGLLFPLGVGFCLTAGIADNDNTSAGAGVTMNFSVSPR